MDQEPDVIRQQIEETRSSLTEKLETLESQVRGTVENAKGTIENVKSTVQETVASVKRTFDVNYQTEQHPWVMFGGSVVAGFLVGNLLSQRHERGAGFRMTAAPETYTRTAPSASGDGHAAESLQNRYSATARAETRQRPGLMSRLIHQFDDEIDKVKELAIGATMALVRDVAKQSLPQFSEHIDDIMNSATAKLGGRPVEEPMFERHPMTG